MAKKTKNPLLVRLGLKIRSLRNEKQISQEHLAELAGVHRTYIGMVERGEKNVTLITLDRFSKALSVDLLALVRGLNDGK